MLRWLLFSIFSVSILFFSIFLYLYFTADDIKILLNQEKSFSFQFALVDDTKENEELSFLAQVIVYPQYRQVVFFCLNTNSFFEDNAIKDMSPNKADHFKNYTKFKNIGNILITRKNAQRLLNLLGGLIFFLEEKAFIKKANYQYPQGLDYFSGEQAIEYTLEEHKFKNKDNEIVQIIESNLRKESLLLNLLWNRKDLSEQLYSRDLRNLASSWLSTSFTKEELSTLFSYFLNERVHFNFLEVPLRIKKKKRKSSPTILEVNKERGEPLFRDWLERAKIRWQKVDESYSIQILNGTEVKGFARRVKFVIQNLGLNVLDVDNFEPKPVKKTVVLIRSGNTKNISHFLEQVEMNLNKIYFNRKLTDVDISFLIGLDFTLGKLSVR